MRIDEINARLAEIRADMEQRGDQLTEAEVAAYETEVQSLTTERAALMQTAERRNGLLAQLAQGDAGVSVRGAAFPAAPGTFSACIFRKA